MKEIALTGFIQILFFSLLILTKKQKETKDYFLVVFLLFVGAELIYRYLLYIIPESENQWLILFDIFYWALFGPFTLLYILSTTGKIQRISRRHLLHFIPLLFGLFGVKDIFFGNTHYSSFVEYYINSTGLTKMALYFWEFSSPVYILYSLFILIKHKKSVKNYFSDITGRDIKWLTILLTGFVIYLFASYIIWVIEDIFLYEIKINALDILPAVLTVYVFFIGFYGFKQSGVLFDLTEKSNRKLGSADNKYIKSGLNNTERLMLATRLIEVMETKKPYLENDLNINELAEMLNTNFHKLSQVINESFHRNFYDFINMYRVEEIKRLLNLPESKNYTIISVAYDCGFSSKSSFYNAFKKNTNLTPGEYIKRINSLSSSVA
ncbi:MAG: AraC family transcriptional regulator [Desulfobacula sp.]|nr:AraC family transcriptional regulator [Desulfobacula sp.]